MVLRESRVSYSGTTGFGSFLEGCRRVETIVNYTDPEARFGNMAGISPEAESVPTLPRSDRGLFGEPPTKPSIVSPMLVIRPPLFKIPALFDRKIIEISNDSSPLLSTVFFFME